MPNGPVLDLVRHHCYLGLVRLDPKHECLPHPQVHVLVGCVHDGLSGLCAWLVAPKGTLLGLGLGYGLRSLRFSCLGFGCVGKFGMLGTLLSTVLSTHVRHRFLAIGCDPLQRFAMPKSVQGLHSKTIIPSVGWLRHDWVGAQPAVSRQAIVVAACRVGWRRFEVVAVRTLSEFLGERWTVDGGR